MPPIDNQLHDLFSVSAPHGVRTTFMRKYQQAASDIMMLMTTFPASALSDCHTSQEYRNWMADRLEEVAAAIRTGPDRAKAALPAPEYGPSKVEAAMPLLEAHQRRTALLRDQSYTPGEEPDYLDSYGSDG